MGPAFGVSSISEAGLHGLRQQADVAGPGVVEVVHPQTDAFVDGLRNTAADRCLALKLAAAFL
jgi:hypothetical protein